METHCKAKKGDKISNKSKNNKTNIYPEPDIDEHLFLSMKSLSLDDKNEVVDTVAFHHLLLNLDPSTHPSVFDFLVKEFKSVADVTDRNITDYDRMAVS